MPDRSQVRKRLNDVLRSDSDLNAFCHDFFPHVYARFTNGMDRTQKVTLLLERTDDPAKILAKLEKYTDNGSAAGVPAPPMSVTNTPGPPAHAPPVVEIDWRNPFSVLKAAVVAVPVMKYALGVAGLGAVVAIVTRGFGLDAGTATVGALIVLALMTVLIVIAVAARRSENLARQAAVLTWGFVVMTLAASGLLLSSLFFQKPRPLRCLVHDELCIKAEPTLPPAPPPPAPTQRRRSSI